MDPDITADIRLPVDRGEPVGAMEPLLIPEGSPRRNALLDRVLELTARSTGFRRSLPEGVARALADLVRSMNCYYSNLIEGHATHPVEIERALRGDYSADVRKRDLQLEARAHVEVQRWIDAGGLEGRVHSEASIREIHRRFCEHLPAELLQVEDPLTKDREQVVPGELRRRDVRVGGLVPVSPGAVPRFLARFSEIHSSCGRTDAVLGLAAAHHRLLWIHPFLDGNGRVARLMSHATTREVLDSGGLWSIARGLARNVEEYRAHLARCDLPRRNDLDGRGARSEEALAAFTRFFLETCIDQVDFMERLVNPGGLRGRILAWAEEEARLGAVPPRAGAVLDAILYRGEIRRADVAAILGASERHGRRTISALFERGVLAAAGPRAPLRLAFPAALAPRWMPGLFPEGPG